jgi:hypothetical protein
MWKKEREGWLGSKKEVFIGEKVGLCTPAIAKKPTDREGSCHSALASYFSYYCSLFTGGCE